MSAPRQGAVAERTHEEAKAVKRPVEREARSTHHGRSAAPRDVGANHQLAGAIPPPRISMDRVVAPARRTGGASARPLPDALRERFAPVVGVRAARAARIHIGPEAQAWAVVQRARAIADGVDIYFAEGQYRPGTLTGDALIVHELAHVGQALSGLLGRPARKAMDTVEHDAMEAEADAAAQHLTDDEVEGRPRDEHTDPSVGPFADIAARISLLVGPNGPQQTTTSDNGRSAAGRQSASAEGAPAGGVARADGVAQAAGVDGVTGANGMEGVEGVAAVEVASAGAAEPAAAALPPDLPLMPDPPTAPSAAEQQRVRGVKRRAGATATSTATAPKPAENVSASKAAVATPQEESNARAAEQVVAELGETVKPSVAIVALCERIKELIRSKRPADENAVIDSRPEAVATEAGGAVQGNVTSDVDGAKRAYGPIDAAPKGPQPVQPPGIEPLPQAAPAPSVDARAATPDAIPPDQVNLDGDAQQMESKADEAGLDKDAAQLVEGGPVGDAHAARGEMGELAKESPAEVLKKQNEALATSDANMAALQMKALQALRDTRAGHVTGVAGQRDEMKEGAEDLRTRLSNKAQGIFDSAQSRVQDLLRDVPTTAMDKWTKGLPPISRRFKDDLEVVSDKVEERHSGVSGFFVAGWDAVAGLPDWVKKAYDTAETNFGDDVCELITGISVYVNGIIKIADEIINDARTQISAVFATELPAEDAAWAAEQERTFGKKLDDLHAKAEATRNTFDKELIDNAGNAVQAAREEIQKLRKAAGGLWGRFLDAVGRFLDDPIKFIIDGLLELVGISPPAFWAVVAKIGQVLSDIVDAPMKFANNLMDGVSKGFSLFFDNIGKHLLEGLIEWLLSGLKDEGISIEIPKEFSLKSVVGFFLQLLGISWARIRKLLVEQLGEKAVMVIEKSAGIIYTLATKGLSGIVDDIKQFLDPQTIVDTIVDVAVKYIAETLIVKVAVKLLAMLNPAGAILAAIEAIYRVLKWIFTNAARIFHLIEAIVNGMSDVIAGNIGGVAKTVEKALAMLVAPVIDFLADYLGLGGLPGKVAQAVKGLQGWVEGVMRSVIKWLVELGKKLMRALGLGEKDDDDKDQKKGGGDIGETLTFTEGDETHHLYIKISGPGATVMVSSTPLTLTAWLDTLERKSIPALKNKDKEATATGLVNTARSQLAETDAVADEAATAQQSIEPADAEKTSELEPKVDAKQEALRNTLDQLGTMFGKPMIVKSLKVKGAAKVTSYSDALVISIESTTSGSDLHKQATGPDYVKDLLERRKGEVVFDDASGELTLGDSSASALGATTAAEAMGAAAAEGSGAARIILTRGAADMTIAGAIDEVRVNLATGDAPEFKPIVQDAHGDKVQIKPAAANLTIADVTDTPVIKRLSTARSQVFASAKTKAGAELQATTAKAFVTVGDPIEKMVGKGWLGPNDRKTLADATPELHRIVTGFLEALEIQTLERASQIADTQVDTLVFNMTVPPAVVGNATYRANFEAEVRRQLEYQAAGLNELTVDNWIVNVATYKAPDQAWIKTLGTATRLAVLEEIEERIKHAAATAERESAELRAAQVIAAKVRSDLVAKHVTVEQAIQTITHDEYITNQFTGRWGNEVEWRAEHSVGIQELLKTLEPQWAGLKSVSAGYIKNAITHNADQVGGGEGQLPDINKVAPPGPGEDAKAWKDYLAALEPYIGAAKVNSRIGPGWTKNVNDLLTRINARYPQEASYPLWRMNSKLDVTYE